MRGTVVGAGLLVAALVIGVVLVTTRDGDPGRGRDPVGCDRHRRGRRRQQ